MIIRAIILFLLESLKIKLNFYIENFFTEKIIFNLI